MCKDSLCGAKAKKADTIEGDSHRETLSFYMSRHYLAVSRLTAEEDNRRVLETLEMQSSQRGEASWYCLNNETRQDWRDWWRVDLLSKTLIFVWKKLSVL